MAKNRQQSLIGYFEGGWEQTDRDMDGFGETDWVLESIRRPGMKLKTGLVITAVICGAVLTGVSTSAPAADTSLSDIAAAVRGRESALQNVTIQYVCTNSGKYGSSCLDDRESFPGMYMPESGVLTLNNGKMKLERTYYERGSVTKTIKQTIAFDGTKTVRLTEDAPHGHGLVGTGRWYGGFGLSFNPLVTLSATGEQALSDELSAMNPEPAGEELVNGVPCKVFKLYLHRDNDGAINRTFKLYVDPGHNGALVKVEKYYDNFACLRKTMEVKELVQVSGVYLASKAVLTDYNRPDAIAPVSYPTWETEMVVTGVTFNQAVAESAFRVAFPAGALVNDGILNKLYTVETVEPPKL